jgi:hypothetical protein
MEAMLVSGAWVLLAATVALVGVAGGASPSGSESGRPPKNATGGVRFVHAEAETGTDVDVLAPDGRPLFRILIPEAVTAESVGPTPFLSHQTPGVWREVDGLQVGTVRSDPWVEIRLALKPLEQGLLVAFMVKNLSPQPMVGVGMDVCVGLSHLPSRHEPWINRDFLPADVPLDRNAAGRYWFERVAPHYLKAWVSGRWQLVHPRPDAPRADDFLPYGFTYLEERASLMAVDSLDGTKRLFEAWDCPCRVRRPFWGNACLHLLPVLADRLEPGQEAFHRAEVAVTAQTWDQIAQWQPGLHEGEWGRMLSRLRE